MLSSDVIVLGGGLIGLSCARVLAGSGFSVRVLDSGAESGAASWAAAGLLAPLEEGIANDPVLSLSVRGRDLYRELAPSIKEETGIDVRLSLDGILQLAFSPEEAERLTDTVAWQRQMGFKVDWFQQDDVLERHPGISPTVLGAKLAREDGAIDPRQLLKGFSAAAKRSGAELARGVKAVSVVINNNKVTGVKTDKETLAAGIVVVAAGAWSGRIRGLPRPLSVEPIRGQMAAADWPDSEPSGIVYGGGGYMLHRDGEALVGSTMEHVGFDASTTADGLSRLQTILARVYPAMDGAKLNRSWAGLRPMTPDGRPIVGRDPDTEGLLYATGHGRNGVLLAGITGEIIGRVLAEEPVVHTIDALDPSRFWRLPL